MQRCFPRRHFVAHVNEPKPYLRKKYPRVHVEVLSRGDRVTGPKTRCDTYYVTNAPLRIESDF